MAENYVFIDDTGTIGTYVYNNTGSVIPVPSIKMGNTVTNENVTINSTSITLANSTVSFTIPRPTYTQVLGSYILVANGAWLRTGDIIGSASVNTDAQFSFTNNISFISNVTIGKALIANTSAGAAGQVLTSNGSGTFWSNVVNTTSSYTFTGVHTHTSNVLINGAQLTVNGANFTVNNANMILNGGLVANGYYGTSGQVLTSNGTGIYWTSVSGSSISLDMNTAYSFSNNISFGKGIYANGSIGSAGQVLTSNGSVVYWSVGGVTTQANNTDSQSFYFPMSNVVSGAWTNGVVSNTQLYFQPSTGTLNAVDFNSFSDIRKKKDIVKVENPLDIISKLNGVKFNWVESNKPSLGLIAQEVERVLPQLVNDSEGVKTLNYNGIIAVLVESVKEQQNEINRLKQIIESQQGG
jgi:hypothetical protein